MSTLEDQIIALAADVAVIKADVEAIKAAPAPVASVDLSGVIARLDAISAQFAATPAPAPAA